MPDANEDDYSVPQLAELRETETVYQPAEDSHLLATTVIEHIENEDRVLDVGTGSGYVAGLIREQTGASVVGVDLNPEACRQAREAGVPVVRGDLVEPFADGVFDVVVCNPPYLPTPPEHEWGDWMEAALSGGPDGRRMIDPLLETVSRVLTADGCVYLLISTLTDRDAVGNHAASNGFETTLLAEESHPFEKLLVLALQRSPQ